MKNSILTLLHKMSGRYESRIFTDYSRFGYPLENRPS